MERLTASTQNNVLVRARDNCSVWTTCLLTSYLLAALPKGLITQTYKSLPGCVEAFSLPQYANHAADCGLYTLRSHKCVVYTCKERHHLEVILFENSQSK